ncbi:MAG: NAD(P)H-hydrate dehydratase [Myxococcales bacterium]|nr:NAD(P)H-hydrate dehydratase [Myxococcales bacterium]
MIPLLGREQVRKVDRDAVEQLGLPSIALMENAGRGAFECIARRFLGQLERVVIVGGHGQNGGDGWVVARHLALLGHRPLSLLVGAPERVTGDAAINWNVLEAMGAERRVLTGSDAADELEAELKGASLIVDALFGTGLDRPIAGLPALAVAAINAADAPVVALDLPSGVDADSGAVLGVAVRAAVTVTFAAYKPGLLQHPARALAGELHCASIGAPLGAGASGEPDFGLIEDADVARWLPARAADAHKGEAGRVLLVAGSPGRTGAAQLAGLGALRAGAGLVTLAARGAAREALDAKVTELMTLGLPADAAEAEAAVRELAAGVDAVVIGPGLGLDAGGRALARKLSLSLAIPMVVDADALTALDGALEALQKAPAARVLTPHPGEAGRLLGRSSAEVQADRYAAARTLAARSGQTAVLKGAGSLVATGGRLWVCGAGSPAMAVAGTGDVLAGALGAMLAVDGGALTPHRAAASAVQLHARAGELAAVDDRGLLASELAARLPQALRQCRA